MLNHPTFDQLRTLKLDGMADAFAELQAQDQAGDLGHAEWLALLLDREGANRGTKRLNTRLRSAKLRHVGASVEDVDYRARRQLDKTLFQQLTTCKWIGDHRNLLITGPCGVNRRGKLTPRGALQKRVNNARRSTHRSKNCAKPPSKPASSSSPVR